MKELTRELENKEPCGALMDLALGADLDVLDEDQKVSLFIIADRAIAALSYVKLSILRGIGDIAELAMANHEPEQSMVRERERSEALEILPLLSDLMRQGKLDPRRLEAVRERVVNMTDPDMITQVDAALVEVAPGLTRTQLARRTTALVAQIDPTGYEQRRQKACQHQRRVECAPLPDGMAQLKVVLPAVDARAAYDLLTQDARALVKDDRTTDQKRADAFMDRFLGYGVDRKVKVRVTLSMETLMGLTEDPGLLDGYGPISADSARQLAALGPWRGILLDEYRRAVALSKHTYRPDASIREMSEAIGCGMCAAPGCTTPIQELDHTTPWPKGKTTASELKGYCSHHHHLKHGDYTVTLNPDGSTRWLTPLGRHYTTHPHQY